MKLHMLVAVGLAGICRVAADAGAQTAPANQEPAGKRLETVTVLGEKQKEDPIPVDAAFTESRISEETLRNLSPGATTTVQTLLNTVPSIFANTAGPNGMRTDIKFRAFVDGQFGETVDGIPLNDIFNAGVTAQAENRNNVLLIPSIIDGVDVYRGINNPLVNTYNSLGGTINFRLRQPTAEAGGEAGLDYGSFHTLGWHARGDSGDWGGLRQSLAVTHTASDGWLNNTQDWNTNVFWAAKYDFAEKSQLYANVIYNVNHGHTPMEVPLPLIAQFGDEFQYPRDWYAVTNDDTNYLALLGLRVDLTDVVHFDSKFYGGSNAYKRTSYSNPLYQQGNTVNGQVQPWLLQDSPSGFAFWNSYPVPPTYDPVATFGSLQNGTQYHFYGYTGSVYGYLATLSADLPHNRLAVGGDISYGQLHSREYWYGTYDMPMTTGYNNAWDEYDDRLLLSAYAQDEVHFWDDRAHITPGVKFLQATTTDSDSVGFYYAQGGNLSGTERFIAPTLGASVAVIPHLDLYASFGKNMKFPDISAFYGGFQGTSVVPVNVKPEYVDDYEVGIRYKAGGLLAEFNAYQENFRNTFVTSTNPATQLVSYSNAGSSRYRGVEMQLDADFGKLVMGDLSSYVNASYNQALYTTSANIGDTTAVVLAGQHVTNVPAKLLSAGLVWNWDNWRFAVDGRYVGQQYLDMGFAGTPVDPTTIVAGQPTHIPSYFLLGVGIVKVVPLDIHFAKALRLSVNAENLTNKRYLAQATTYPDINGTQNDVYGIIGAPRAIYGSVSVFF